MATWIAHLRVAENILKRGFDLDTESFIVGNIGPDSGVPNEDKSNFNPPPKITHWQNDNKNIDAEAFWNEYLSNNEIKNNYEAHSFYIGYYVHLLTDIYWKEGLFKKKKQEPLYKDGLDKDPNFIWTIKKDWYGLDYLFLEKNPDFIFFTLFKNVKTFPDYLEYFPKGAFKRQVKYITDFYLGENEETKDNFIYLKEEEMDNFIKFASEKIINILENEKRLSV